MQIKKHDFVEIDFTGRVKNGEVFDSTFKEELQKLHKGHDHEVDTRPLIFSIGHGMFLDALDDFLIGKDVGGTYDVELPPEKAFGVRDSRLVQMVPVEIFRQQRVSPAPGMTLNFDGRHGKILTVSGGRVMVDFNHSLSGKTVDYHIKVLRILSEMNEKVRALNEFFFRKDLKFSIEGKKLIIHAEKKLSKFVTMFADKFKEILDLDLEVVEIEEKAAEPVKK